MNFIEKLLLDFVEKALINNPALLGKLLEKLLEKLKLDPTIEQGVIDLIEQLVAALIPKV